MSPALWFALGFAAGLLSVFAAVGGLLLWLRTDPNI